MRLAIHNKIIWLIVVPVSLVYSAILVYALLKFKLNAEIQVRSRMTELTQRYASQTEAYLLQAGHIAQMTASFLETVPNLDESRIYHLLHENVRRNPLVFASTVAFAPGVFEGRPLFSPLVYRDGAGLREIEVGEHAYDYTKPEWDLWTQPELTGRAIWTEPFLEKRAGNALVVAYAAPFYHAQRFAGVTSIEIKPEDLNRVLRFNNQGVEDFFFLGKNGRIIHHYHPTGNGHPIQDFTEGLNDRVPVQLVNSMVAGKTGNLHLVLWDTDQPRWLFFAPVPSTGWSLVAIVDQQTELAMVRRQARENGMLLLFALSTLILIALWVSRRITRPLADLNETAQKIAAGHLDSRIEVRNRDEIGELTASFNEMARKLAERETALLELNEELESRVVERTAELQASESKFRSLVENVPGATYRCLVDREWTMTFISDAIEEISGYPASDFIDNRVRSYASIIHPEDRAQVGRKVLQGVENHRPFMLEYRILHADGRLRWVYEKGRAIFSEQGRASFLDGTILDITPRKKDAQLIENSKRRLQEIADSIPGAVYQFHLDGPGNIIFDFMSDGIEKLVGVTRQQALENSSNVLEKLHPDDKAVIRQRLIESTETLKAWHHQFKVESETGATKWIRGEAAPHSDADDKMTWNGYWIDITAQKNLERELAEAKRSAENSNEAKSTFLANMSHEIRTPMNAIIGLSHLALQTSLTARQKDYLRKISASAKTLLGIINDILDFSKIEAGKMEMEVIEFELYEVLDNLKHIVGTKADQKGIAMLIEIDPEIPNALIGDPLRLGQVLINLASNAVKFTEQGEVRIGVRKLMQDDSQLELRFSVEDTGIGIPEKKKARLFSPFTQADSSTIRQYGGTGLGLSICKRLVELMHGEIGFESEAGRGSCFHFTAHFGYVAERISAVPRLPAPLQGAGALVVDANPNSREIFARFLESFGFRVGESASGRKALDEIRLAPDTRPYELVLIDWNLPDIGGLEASKQIKMLDGRDNAARIILLSAYGREELFRQAEESGLDAVLVKPVSRSALFETILQTFGIVEEATVRDAVALGRTFHGGALHDARILLVEDNEINQQVALELLESEGMRVTVKKNGREAVDTVRQHRYDAVLMDIQMPLMDGFEATRQIRALPGCEDLPIIAMTANALADDRRKSVAAGMNDHVTKPIDVHELQSALYRWIHPDRRTTSEIENTRIEAHEISGMDIHATLKNFTGHRGLLEKSLHRLADTGSARVEKLEAALARGDLAAARKTVRGIIHMAENIGAGTVVRAAQSFFRVIGDARSDGALELSKFKRELQALADAIGEFARPESRGKSESLAPGADRQRIHQLLRDLRARLQDDDASAGELMEPLRKQIRESSVATLLDNLEVAVSGYAFDTALARLDELEARWSE